MLKYAQITELVYSFDTGQQCPVTQPTITSDVICQVSQQSSRSPLWGVSYTCNDPGGTIYWTGSIIAHEVTIAAQSGETVVSLTGVSGLSVTETHTTESSCINSTLTFTGDNLAALDGATLNCRGNNIMDRASNTIAIPGMKPL